MNRHFRPQIQNGPITKRTQAAYSSKLASQTTVRSSAPVLTQLWSAPPVEAGVLAQRGLSLLALDEQLRSTATNKAASQTSSRPYVLLGIVCCGAVLASAFMFGLRERFIAHAIGREEIKMNVQTQEAKVKTQQLKAKVEQAASPAEIDQQARQASGLAPLQFEQKKIESGAKKITATEKAKTQATPPKRGRRGAN